jgi:hypothetical protein
LPIAGWPLPQPATGLPIAAVDIFKKRGDTLELIL